MFWVVTLWKLWIRRNNILVNDDICNVNDIVTNIKITTWVWYVLGEKNNSFKNFKIDGRVIWTF